MIKLGIIGPDEGWESGRKWPEIDTENQGI